MKRIYHSRKAKSKIPHPHPCPLPEGEGTFWEITFPPLQGEGQGGDGSPLFPL